MHLIKEDGMPKNAFAYSQDNVIFLYIFTFLVRLGGWGGTARPGSPLAPRRPLGYGPRGAQSPRQSWARRAGMKLGIDNLKCFGKVELLLEQRVTVVIGENGDGKTTLAQLLVSLLGGQGLQDFSLRAVRGQR